MKTIRVSEVVPIGNLNMYYLQGPSSQTLSRKAAKELSIEPGSTGTLYFIPDGEDTLPASAVEELREVRADMAEKRNLFRFASWDEAFGHFIESLDAILARLPDPEPPPVRPWRRPGGWTPDKLICPECGCVCPDQNSPEHHDTDCSLRDATWGEPRDLRQEAPGA